MPKRHLLTIIACLGILAALACASVSAIQPSPDAPGTVLPRAAYTAELFPPSFADQSAALAPGSTPAPQGLPRYNIQVVLDIARQAYRGRMLVEVTNQESVPLEQLYFRLYPNGGGMYGSGFVTVSQALVAGQPAVLQRSLLDTILEVSLPRPLNPGEQIAVQFDFDGNVPLDFGGSGLVAGYGIFNYTQGVLALADWYPILAVYDQEGWNLDPVYSLGDAVYSDAAFYTVEVIVDSSLVVAASGAEVARVDVQDGWRLYRYVSGPAREFTIFAGPDHLRTTRQAGGVTIHSYYLPGHNAGGELAADVAARSLEIFTQAYGPYPYQQFNVVEAPLNLASGVEYPAFTLIASRLYADPASPDLAATVAHEVAHQWWYNVVSNDVIEAPWMDEALATYSSLLYWEQAFGPQALAQALAYHQERYDEVVRQGLDDQVAAGVPYYQENRLFDSYSPVVYSKGALFYHALRQEIGEAAFWAALQAYYAGHWFTIASPSELMDAFEITSGRQLDSFYEQWLFSPRTGGAVPTPTATPTPTPIPTPTPTTTPPPPPVTFAVIGDYGSDDQNEEAVANLVLSWNPDLIITLGDNNYPDGSEDTIDAAIGQYFHSFIYPYNGIFGDGAYTNRFFPTLGNHDLYTDDGQPYFDYFSLPGNERYYDFEWGPVHLFALNTNDSEPNGVGVSSIQAQWLRESLAASISPWNIVYMHHAPYTSGSSHSSTDWAQWPYREWGASAVLSAHEHVYERLEIDGIPYFVNGLGGGGIYGFDEILPTSLARYDDDYGAMLVEADGQRIIFQFINVRNEVIDLYEMRR